MDFQQSTGFIIWLTGMKKAGKTTLATQLALRLTQAGRVVQLLDEDGEAKFLIEGLGPSKDDQVAAVRRFGYTAKAVAKAGGIAICAALSPFREPREQLRRESRRFVEIFVDCTIEKLMDRDGKDAYYKKAMTGEVTQVAGVDLPYEPPVHAELVLHTEQEAIEASLTRIFQALVDGKFIGPTEFGRLTGGLKPKRKGKGAKAGKEARPPKVIKIADGRKPAAKPVAKAAKPPKAAAKKKR
jgi:adenylyl-sulfate kinase